jgi:hypothetical protein
MIFVSPERHRIFEFADGSYMMHPSLVLNPVLLTAFVLGIPFLLWRVRDSLAAQLLLGVRSSPPSYATFLRSPRSWGTKLFFPDSFGALRGRFLWRLC